MALDAGRVRFWNTEVRNSSALRVALTRKDEIGWEMDREVVGSHWDIEKVTVPYLLSW